MAEINYLDYIFKEQDKLTIIAIIIISLLFSRNIYKKQMVNFENLKGDINKEEEKGEILDRIIILNENIKRLKGKSWDTVDINLIIEKIYSIGLESGIKIRHITPLPRKEEKNYIMIPFSLSFQTTYREVIHFIKRIETQPLLLRIKSVRAISTGGEESNEKDPVLDLNMSLEAVYMK